MIFLTDMAEGFTATRGDHYRQRLPSAQHILGQRLSCLVFKISMKENRKQKLCEFSSDPCPLSFNKNLFFWEKRRDSHHLPIITFYIYLDIVIWPIAFSDGSFFSSSLVFSCQRFPLKLGFCRFNWNLECLLNSMAPDCPLACSNVTPKAGETTSLEGGLWVPVLLQARPNHVG